MLHLSEPAEELPIRVLDPARDDGFIALIERMLEIQQADHQTRRTTWPSFF